jgi:hypothetical protein
LLNSSLLNQDSQHPSINHSTNKGLPRLGLLFFINNDPSLYERYKFYFELQYVVLIWKVFKLDYSKILWVKTQLDLWDYWTQFNSSILIFLHNNLNDSILSNLVKPKSKFAYKPFSKNELYNTEFNIVSLYSEDNFVNPGEINLKNFVFCNNEINLDQQEEVSENFIKSKSLFTKYLPKTSIKLFSLIHSNDLYYCVRPF